MNFDHCRPNPYDPRTRPARTLRRAMNGERTMLRRPTHEQPEAQESVVLLLFQPPAPPDERSDGRGPEQPPGCWRRCWSSLWPVALHVTLLLLLGTGLAAQTVIYAQSDGLAEKFAMLMDYLSIVGGMVAAGGLIWSGMCLREGEEDWARAAIPGGVATAAAGLILIAAAQLISDLSASGAIPIP